MHIISHPNKSGLLFRSTDHKQLSWIKKFRRLTPGIQLLNFWPWFQTILIKKDTSGSKKQM